MPDPVAARRLLAALRELQRELIELDHLARSDTLERVREAIGRIGELSSPAAILERAPEELGRAAPFATVLLSEVREATLAPQALWLADAPERAPVLLGQLARASVRLEYPRAELEAAHNHATLLAGASERGHRIAPVLGATLGCESYVVAPLLLEGRTVGLLHAAHRSGQPPVDERSAALASLYADGVARAFERASLRQILQRHRDELHAAVQWVNARLNRLASDEQGPQLSAVRVPALGGDVDSLTQREIEVLELMARGRTNAQIAQALVISDGTVKYHVKNVLRKLGAASRAEAVACYLQG